jgi:signal transduction histidine kinase
MVLISFVAFGVIGRVVAFIIHGSDGPANQELMETIRDSINRDTLRAAWIMFIAFSLILTSIISNYLNYRMTKRIVEPLEPLGEGVRQIQSNNLAYRIDYQGNDEFRPVCDAFNEMAEKLETSTAEKKKDEANRRELIAGISHDLRTPLTSIIGCIEGIETGVASTPQMQKQYHTYIKNEAANMKHIIEQLFLFSKLDMDEFPLILLRVDITTAIYEMLEDSLSDYEKRGLTIHLTKMPKDIFVSADVRLLRNVIVNILENSIKYKTKEQGQMEISAAVMEDHVLLRFADDGPGVEADMLPKLSEVFFRADPSRSTIGSGLGLAICAKIIQGMGGTIHAESPPQGGLAIVIRLPISKGEITNGGHEKENIDH